MMWFLSSPVPSSAKPGCSVLSFPTQVWASLPGASCPLPAAGARSQLLGWLPSSHCPRAPRLLPAQARGLRVGVTVLGPHSEPVLRSQCHHSLYGEEPALRHTGELL